MCTHAAISHVGVSCVVGTASLRCRQERLLSSGCVLVEDGIGYRLRLAVRCCPNHCGAHATFSVVYRQYRGSSSALWDKRGGGTLAAVLAHDFGSAYGIRSAWFATVRHCPPRVENLLSEHLNVRRCRCAFVGAWVKVGIKPRSNRNHQSFILGRLVMRIHASRQLAVSSLTTVT